MTSPSALARGIENVIASRLTQPRPSEDRPRWLTQSLARGEAGTTLLHIERALAGSEAWSTTHVWLDAATCGEVNAAIDAGLYVGAPAISFLLHAATADGGDRYKATRTTLDTHVVRLVHRRVDTALARISRGDATAFAEYDLFYGLTGIGVLLLRHLPGNDALGRTLDYLVRLTQPLRTDVDAVPGWWVDHDPDPLLPTPGGHANNGMAHGIAGPLTFLALAMRHGSTVEGQREAIERINDHFDHCGRDSETGTWWPQWITHRNSHAGRPENSGPKQRPSWCYGTPGIARAQQLAALAVGDIARQHRAEHALAACPSDARQLERITDLGLCHGWAGLYQTTWRAAADALTPTVAEHLPHLAHQLTRLACAADHNDPRFLDGAVGLALALRTATHNTPPLSGWDSCLLMA